MKCKIIFNPDNPECLECGEDEETIGKYKKCQEKYGIEIKQKHTKIILK